MRSTSKVVSPNISLIVPKQEKQTINEIGSQEKREMLIKSSKLLFVKER
jgi:hypothetical protein